MKLAISATGVDFWTSGSNEGDFCNTLNVYSWCSSNEILAPQLLTQPYWRNLTAKDPELDRCLAFKFNKTDLEITGFEHEPCNSTNFYICEVLYINPV